MGWKNSSNSNHCNLGQTEPSPEYAAEQNQLQIACFMRKAVGTRVWSVTGDGVLRRTDRQRLIMQAMLARMALIPKRLRIRLGLTDQRLARIDIETIRVPDSAVALRAGQLLESLSAPWLVNHCFRTYLWGVMLGKSDRIDFDEELFFVASALHDLGLTDSYRCSTSCTACFAVEGARAAERFAESAGWPDERRDRLSEAISLHLNVSVGLEYGAEAHLLHEGAALDVIGARSREFDATSFVSALERYPRMGFKVEMAAAMKEQARSRPQSRAAFLVGLGFTRMIRESQWND